MSGTEILSSLNKTNGSGIDIASLVKNLVAVETEVEQSTITKDKEAIETKISELGKLSSQLSNLNGRLDTYSLAAKVGLTNSHPANLDFAITNQNLLPESQFNINVSQLAKNQIIHIDFGDGITSASPLGTGNIEITFGAWSGTNSQTFTSNGRTVSLSIASGQNTLAEVVAQLNTVEGLQASLVSSGTTNSLIIRSEPGKNSGFRMSNDVVDQATALAGVKFDVSGENSSDLSKLTQAAQNALINIDGVAIESADNVIENAISGTEISLLKVMAGDENATISFSDDRTELKASVRALVEELNGLKSDLKDLTSRGANGAESGPLAGDIRATQILRQLEKVTTTAIEGFGEPVYLSQLGFRTELDGLLSFDEAAFDKAVENDGIRNNFRDIIFGVGINTNSSGFSGVFSGDKKPTAGSYDFQIEAISNSRYEVTLGNQTYTSDVNSEGGIELRPTGSPFDGLTFSLSGTLLSAQASGTFSVGVGFIPDFKSYLAGLLGPNGEIAKHTVTYEENLVDLETREQSISEKQQTLTDRYNLEFGKMETAISGLKRQGEYITSLMDMWENYSK
jgi:flagellar hook-associated protein 2